MVEIFSWMQQNAALLSFFANVAVVVVWVLYAQLFYQRYKRRKRPRIFIMEAQGAGLDSTCLAVNMSEEPVLILGVIAVTYTSEQTFSRPITDYSKSPALTDSPQEVESIIKLGPLAQGDFMRLGTCSSLMEMAAADMALDGRLSQEQKVHSYAEQIDVLELRIAAIFGPEDRPIGARRRFTVTPNREGVDIRPESVHTEQLTSRSQQHIVEGWLENWILS